jgi:hypothetical protein
LNQLNGFHRRRRYGIELIYMKAKEKHVGNILEGVDICFALLTQSLQPLYYMPSPPFSSFLFISPPFCYSLFPSLVFPLFLSLPLPASVLNSLPLSSALFLSLHLSSCLVRSPLTFPPPPISFPLFSFPPHIRPHSGAIMPRVTL